MTSTMGSCKGFECSRHIRQSSINTETAVYLGSMVHKKPKQNARVVSQSSEQLLNGLKCISLDSQDNCDVTDHLQLKDRDEAYAQYPTGSATDITDHQRLKNQDEAYAHCPTRSTIVCIDKPPNESDFPLQNGHSGNILEATLPKRVANGYNDDERDFINGDVDRDCFLPGSHHDDQTHLPKGVDKQFCRRSLNDSTDSFDSGRGEEECIGEDEHDGLLCDLLVHTKHFVRSFFGKSFFRFNREDSSENGDDDERIDEIHNVLIPSPFQNGYEFLGILIKQEDMGWRVTRVLSNSLACKAHLKESDILSHLDDEDLTNRELEDIRGMFRRVQESFKLTIWREIHEGETTCRTQLTISISIAETVNRSFEIEVSVRRPRFRARPRSTQCRFVTQDPDGGHQIYMHYEDDGSLSMRELVEEDPGSVDRASFYFDLYQSNIPLPVEGQLCTIRHRTNGHEDRFFNCQTGLMELLPRGQTRARDMQIYFIYRMPLPIHDKAFKFKVFRRNGDQDEYLKKVDGKIRRCAMNEIQSDAIFRIYSVR
ncbi:uncharacterized protein LOC121430357 [Lytechinus variegatus]|uniref:uncharacterized protein LOC121430357 n=1 Tax=Lytechinus variegatus TaxID=7654 RepID=UPI001BB218BA|nr:uncharacterized protein LOC121430357 [Lytechinus variegatus]XP_041483572.1 uncharacterized protein LOC121430357 [Lytechinus variegatus]